MRIVAAIIIAVIIGFTIALTAQTPKQVEQGLALYKKHNCALCHMIEGKGNKKYPLDGIASKMKVDQMRLWLTKPAEMEAKLAPPPTLKMSSKKFNLSAADVDALLAYLQTLK